MAEAIDRNNRIAMVEMFSPANEAERDLALQNLQSIPHWFSGYTLRKEHTIILML